MSSHAGVMIGIYPTIPLKHFQRLPPLNPPQKKRKKLTHNKQMDGKKHNPTIQDGSGLVSREMVFRVWGLGFRV